MINQIDLIDKILSNNVQYFSNLKVAPLYKLEFIYNLFLESKLTEINLIHSHLKVIKCSYKVENDKGKIFVI